GRPRSSPESPDKSSSSPPATPGYPARSDSPGRPTIHKIPSPAQSAPASIPQIPYPPLAASHPAIPASADKSARDRCPRANRAGCWSTETPIPAPPPGLPSPSRLQIPKYESTPTPPSRPRDNSTASDPQTSETQSAADPAPALRSHHRKCPPAPD